MPKMDLKGMRFGRLTVMQEAEPTYRANGEKVIRWLCQCDCGNTTIVTRQDLRKGDTRSCGCLKLEQTSERSTTHGESKTTLYKRWKAMRKRCNNPNNSDYQHYGGRGIRVCDEWQNYETFKEWALSHGYSDELSIDRINVDGDYEPSNCRFVTMKYQCNNRSNNINISYKGETHTISEWSEITGIQYSTLYEKVKRGLSMEQILCA